MQYKLYGIIYYGAELRILNTLALTHTQSVDQILLRDFEIIQFEVLLVCATAETLEGHVPV